MALATSVERVQRILIHSNAGRPLSSCPLYQLGPYGTRAESQHEKRDLALLKSGTVDPVKPVPTGLRDAGLTTLLRALRPYHCLPVELDAMRMARPVRGRLSRVVSSSASAAPTALRKK